MQGVSSPAVVFATVDPINCLPGMGVARVGVIFDFPTRLESAYARSGSFKSSVVGMRFSRRFRESVTRQVLAYIIDVSNKFRETSG
jgi:hypothetical protein